MGGAKKGRGLIRPRLVHDRVQETRKAKFLLVHDRVQKTANVLKPFLTLPSSKPSIK